MTKGHDKGQMSDREAMKLAWESEKKANPHTAYNSWCRGYEAGLRQALEQPKGAYEVNCKKCNGTMWVCENHPDQEAHECVYCEGAGMPCECHPDYRSRLSAAAPDLLEALQMYVDATYETDMAYPEIYDKARAAIAKGTGEKNHD